MALRSRQIPVDVAARVVRQPTTVPQLADAPFAATGTLEPGIHVHWALPDSCATARASRDAPPQFRGVPDLWLVVRFNPPQGTGPRTYRAWVVDSIAETATPLAQWQPPTRDLSLIHTAPGVLPRVAEGWGEWGMDDPFDELLVGYYPACRTRLGFHDDLADLSGATGKVSYVVIGWYSAPEFDPFRKQFWRETLSFGTHFHADAVSEVAIDVTTSATTLDWSPSFTIQDAEAPASGEIHTIAADAALSKSLHESGVVSAKKIATAFGAGGADSPQQEVLDTVVPGADAASSVLHGSLIDVPLAPGLIVGTPELDTDGVVLYPNVQRAMADVAVRTGADVETDWLDMMLGSLGQQSGTVSGVIDLASAQHARTFQGVPGRSTWFARLDIRPKLLAPGSSFQLADLGEGAFVASGNWSTMSARSAEQFASKKRMLHKAIGPQFTSEPPAGPAPPTKDETLDWIRALLAAFATAKTAAAASGTPLDARLVRVQDYRSNAAPVMLGPSADGSGTAQAGWVLDLGGVDALVAPPDAEIDLASDARLRILAELYGSVRGAIVHLPDAGNIFERPGPRWYRPWSPHLVLFGAKRSYRHGMDGRFRLDGHLQTRLSGEELVGFKAGGHTILGADLVSGASALAVAGLPAVARGLVAEHALVDPESARAMVATAHRTGGRAKAPTAKQLTAATRSLWVRRPGILSDPQAKAIAAIDPIGIEPSAAGLQVWRDWYGALFLDTEYTHRRKRWNDAWELPPEFIEAVDRDPAVDPDREQTITQRLLATITVEKVLKENLIEKLTLDPQGNVVHHLPPPDGLTPEAFEELDVVSASLTGLDDALLAAGEREQGGFVHVGHIRLFDAFGTPADWTGDAAQLDPLPPWAVAIPARLAGWGRVMFRLQSAADPEVEATPFTPSVCGFLLPDFVDQALEIYDSDGRAVGQLTATDPIDAIQDAVTQPTTLTVSFTLLPWIADAMPEGADPVDAIVNPTLRQLVRALLAQPLAVSAGDLGWLETGFTAMLRVFDTVRSTLEPGFKDWKGQVRLIGEPIVVLNTRLRFEASEASVAELRGDPPLIQGGLPVLRVRVGDGTRPDDGVLGCLLLGDSPADARFAPVSLEASEKAVLNTMIAGGSLTQLERSIEHPFIKDQVSEFDLPAGEHLDLIVLADVRGGLYATCGLLPRKKVTLPQEFIDPALAALRPTFRIGPILGFERQGAVVPVIPRPIVEGMTAKFVHDDDLSYPESAIPAVLPVGELPPSRVKLTEGWARLEPLEE